MECGSYGENRCACVAMLDINAADGIAGDCPEIADWYIGGRSLSGAMTGAYFVFRLYQKDD